MNPTPIPINPIRGRCWRVAYCRIDCKNDLVFLVHQFTIFTLANRSDVDTHDDPLRAVPQLSFPHRFQGGRFRPKPRRLLVKRPSATLAGNGHLPRADLEANGKTFLECPTAMSKRQLPGDQCPSMSSSQRSTYARVLLASRTCRQRVLTSCIV